MRENEKMAENHDNVFNIGEHVDCLDTIGKWCNAEVKEIQDGRIFVHFTGFATKYDEWISLSEPNPRIQKQWRRGSDFVVNNRIDVLDQMGKWLPAGIVEV